MLKQVQKLNFYFFYWHGVALRFGMQLKKINILISLYFIQLIKPSISEPKMKNRLCDEKLKNGQIITLMLLFTLPDILSPFRKIQRYFEKEGSAFFSNWAILLPFFIRSTHTLNPSKRMSSFFLFPSTKKICLKPKKSKKFVLNPPKRIPALENFALICKSM